MNLVGKRWSLTSVLSGDFIPIEVLSGFLLRSGTILDFRKSSQFLLKSSPIHGLRQGSISPFSVGFISHAAASQSTVACRSVCDTFYGEPSYTWRQESWVTILDSMTQKSVNCQARCASVHVVSTRVLGTFQLHFFARKIDLVFTWLNPCRRRTW